MYFYLKLFPAFTTRFFCEKQKRAQAGRSIRARIIYKRIVFTKRLFYF
jgi:hypothetical protein